MADETREKECGNCTHINMCKYYLRIKEVENEFNGMFKYGEHNHTARNFSKHNVKLCKHHTFKDES